MKKIHDNSIVCVIFHFSNAREGYQSRLSGQGPEDTARDQEANRWGRNGGNPNRYRPDGLLDRYR